MTIPASPSTSFALVVDDDAFIRMDAAAILEDAGFETFEAAHADAAVRVLHECHRHLTLLFTDVQMPGTLDGFALARYVSEHWPHISIVVASGQARPSPGELPEGAHFIAKPFSVQIVHDHLKSMIPDERKPKPLRD